MHRPVPLVVSGLLVVLAAPQLADQFAHAFSASRPVPESGSRRGSLSIRRCWGDAPRQRHRTPTRPCTISVTSLQMMFNKQPGESESAFMKRIQQLASDPKAFELAVLGQNDPAEGGRSTTSLRYSSHPSSSNSTEAAGSSPPSSPASRKGGYQRVEDWDRDQQEQAKSLSWEERVQFDGQRHGNRVQQNEILRHHLKTF